MALFSGSGPTGAHCERAGKDVAPAPRGPVEAESGLWARLPPAAPSGPVPSRLVSSSLTSSTWGGRGSGPVRSTPPGPCRSQFFRSRRPG